MAIYQLANLTSSNNTFTGTNTFNKTIVGPVYESYLTWGGKNFSGSFGPLDASIVPQLGANRFMFLKAAGITIEYSTNGGSSWSNYGATDDQKVALFSSGQGFTVGKASSSSPATASSQLRVTIDTSEAGIYTALNKFCIYVSTSGSSGSQVKIQKALQSTPSNFVDVTTAGLSGWSGYNIINVPSFTTYCNSESSHYRKIRFIFTITSQNSSYAGLSIINIMGFGGVGWTCPSTMAKTGHLYSYDYSQNATFPASISATNNITAKSITATTSFIGSLSGNATTATSLGSAVDVGNTTTPVYFLDGKPVALSYKIESSVPSNAVFTDTTYDEATTSVAGLMSAADKTKLNGLVTITGAATTITADNLTASRALVSDSNGKVAVSAVTSNELGYLDGVTGNIQTQLNDITSKYLNKATSTAQTVYAAITFDNTTASSNTSSGAVIIKGGLGVAKNIYGAAVYGAVWNDLTDSIEVPEDTNLEPGYAYCFDGEKYYKSTKYLDEGFIGIHSDTSGFNMGKKNKGKELDVAVAGFVLAYVDKVYKPGTPLTCSEDGKLTEIKLEDKRDYPERIVGTFWKVETAEEWGSEDKKVPVNGRCWVKIK